MKTSLDNQKMCEELNKYKKHTFNLYDGMPYEWENMLIRLINSLKKALNRRQVLYGYVFNDIAYDFPKIMLVLVNKESTERPFATRASGCIHSYSTETEYERNKAAKSFYPVRPWTEAEKKYLWETKGIKIVC